MSRRVSPNLRTARKASLVDRFAVLSSLVDRFAVLSRRIAFFGTGGRACAWITAFAPCCSAVPDAATGVSRSRAAVSPCRVVSRGAVVGRSLSVRGRSGAAGTSTVTALDAPCARTSGGWELLATVTRALSTAGGTNTSAPTTIMLPNPISAAAATKRTCEYKALLLRRQDNAPPMSYPIADDAVAGLCPFNCHRGVGLPPDSADMVILIFGSGIKSALDANHIGSYSRLIPARDGRLPETVQRRSREWRLAAAARNRWPREARDPPAGQPR